MCDIILFHLNDVAARRGFQEYIDNVRTEGMLELPDKLVELIKATKTIAVSTAECERGFSQMNILASSVRSSLTIKKLSTLMFINCKCVGPPPQEFSPSLCVKTWKVFLSDTIVRLMQRNKLLMKSTIIILYGKG